MLGFSCLSNSCLRVRGRVTNHQSVRWLRVKKPFWLGMAKTKMFVIPVPKHKYTVDENKELARLREEYYLQLNTILNFIKNENPLKVRGGDKTDQAALAQQLEKEMEESFRRNELWNAESAEFREVRMQKTLEEYAIQAKHFVKTAEQSRQQEQERIENIVREEKVKRQSFVTPENLDAAIEECLNSVVEYNFAIDLQGKRIPGKEPLNVNLVEAEVEGEMEESAGG